MPHVLRPYRNPHVGHGPQHRNTSRTTAAFRHHQREFTSGINVELLRAGNVVPSSCGFANLPRDIRSLVYDMFMTEDLRTRKPGRQSEYAAAICLALSNCQSMQREAQNLLSTGDRLALAMGLGIPFKRRPSADYEISQITRKSLKGSEHRLHVTVNGAGSIKLRPLADLAWARYSTRGKPSARVPTITETKGKSLNGKRPQISQE